MRSLKEFAGYQEVYKTPQRLPTFFEQNLVDDNRVVKIFQDDPQGHIRIFYYQYLKFCFEVNHPKSDEMVQKIEELINNPTFQFIFYQEDDPSIFNDNQAKAFTSQFFGELSSGQYTVLDALNTYPIMDVIMVHLFRTLMILMQKIESLDNFIPRDDLLGFLCPFFGIEVQLHDNCIKYVDTDVFAYDQSQNTVYMAYINYTQAPQQNLGIQEQPQLNSQQVIQNYQEQREQPGLIPQSKPASKPPSDRYSANKGSYIASQFFDYTTDNQRLAQKVTTLKKSEHNIDTFSKSEVEKVEVKPTIPQNTNGLGNGMKYVETASISSGSQQRNVQQSHFSNNLNTYAQPDYLSKSNPPVATSVNAPYPSPSQLSSNTVTQPTNTPKYYQEPVQNTYQHQPIPTKDISDSSLVNQYKPPSAYDSSKVMTDPIPKPVSSYESSFNKDILYNPKVEAPLYNPKPEVPLYNTSPPVVAPKNMAVQSKNFGYDSKNTQYAASAISTGPKKKGVFGLNISDEFTGNQAVSCMSEPHKTNVQNIKTRARQYRNSLMQFIK